MTDPDPGIAPTPEQMIARAALDGTWRFFVRTLGALAVAGIIFVLHGGPKRPPGARAHVCAAATSAATSAPAHEPRIACRRNRSRAADTP